MSHRKAGITMLLACLALSFVLFANTIRGDFVYDDLLVLPRSDLHSLSSLPHLLVSPYHLDLPETGIFRPLTLISFSLNFIMFGDSPASFHVINILLHGFNIFLVFLLVSQLTSRRRAFLAALLFAVLPIHIEAVASIVGRGELLLVGFGLLALIYRKRYLWSSLFFFLALLSKETAVAILPLALIFLMVFDRSTLRRLISIASGYLVALVVYFELRYQALGRYILSTNADKVYNPIKFASFPRSLYLVGKVLYLYIQKIFIPYNLASDYSYNQIKLTSSLVHDPQAFFGLLILLGLILALWCTRKRPLILAGLALFFLPYFIISNLIFKTGTIMADRLMYLPSLGVVILIAAFLDWSYTRYKWPTLVALGIIVSLYSITIIIHNRVWLTQEALSRDAYAKSPDSVLTKLGMAQVALAHGKTQEAKAYLMSAQETYAGNVEVLNLLGVVYWTEHDYPQAENYFKQVIMVRPYYQDALVNLSRVYYKEHKYPQAITILTTIADHYQDQAGLQNLRLLMYLEDQTGQYDAVIALGNQLQNPSGDLGFLIGYAYLKKGDQASARQYLTDFSPTALAQHLHDIGTDFE